MLSENFAYLVNYENAITSFKLTNQVFFLEYRLRVRSLGVIWIRISDPRSFGLWGIKGTDESMTRVDSSVPLMNYDPSDLELPILIQITPKERTLNPLSLSVCVLPIFTGWTTKKEILNKPILLEKVKIT